MGLEFWELEFIMCNFLLCLSEDMKLYDYARNNDLSSDNPAILSSNTRERT